MKLLSKTILAVAIVTGIVLSAQLLNPSISGIASAATGNCGCGCTAEAAPCENCVDCVSDECATCVEATACTKKRGCGCKRCKRPRKKLCCPSCTTECDTCTLELDHYEEDKTCFQTEQKTICIPPVRFPWEKCCPPGRTSKTRTVNVLKVHKYKCKACGYKWKLDPLPEPCETESPEPTETVTEEADSEPKSENNIDPVVAPVENGVPMTPTDAPQPGFEPSLEPPSADAVPPAPTES